MQRRSISRTVIGLATAVILASACATTERATAPGEFRDGGFTSVLGSAIKAPGLETVFFDYDRSAIRSDARPTIGSNAAAIEEHPEWKEIILEGHCDERGSEEYNMALGERRAGAVKRYLVNLGIPASRITTLTFGESRPAMPGQDESNWRYNRRVEFGLPR